MFEPLPAMPMSQDTIHSTLQGHYDAMWDAAFGAVARGDIDCDHRLAAGPDPRRGLTLVARPGAALRARFDALLDSLADAEPGQYHYPASDMHVTILPLFTATEEPAAELARLDAYCAAAYAALKGAQAFEIAFAGITLSRGAVLVQGFARGSALDALRERLRSELRARGLDATLDGRYRLVTAHATLLRFIAPLRDAARFAALLAGLRGMPFGVMCVDEVELVINDWTMSAASLELVAAMRLGQAAT